MYYNEHVDYNCFNLKKLSANFLVQATTISAFIISLYWPPKKYNYFYKNLDILNLFLPFESSTKPPAS